MLVSRCTCTSLTQTYILDLENITRNDLRSLDFSETTVTENNSLESKSLLQLLDDRTSLEFLNETNGSVKEQETANNTEIDPVLKTSSKDSSGLTRN